MHIVTTSSQKPVIPIVPVEATRSRTGRPTAEAGPTGRSLYEKHKKIYPRSVKGWFANWRWVMVFVTQLVFYGLPWLRWNDRQAVLFDLGARRFFIFDLVLYPQDFIYLSALLIISAYGLFFFTAIGGRLWCGYACPQTVYTEIFLWVERRFEGERGAHQKRDAGDWTVGKVARKVGKHAAWLTIAWWTGFTFVGYFTPIHTLWGEAFTLSFGPWEWFWVNFYGFATYGNAGFMREQVCKYMCPYARFQSAMYDRDTMTITYDAARGDPRGVRARNADAKSLNLGDCIDCGLCVQVCPTGIDIRDGSQYECTGCTACIDACNGVMDKMHYPRQLIRYATLNGVAKGWSRREMFARVLRPRILIYGTVLLALSTTFVVSLTSRPLLRVDVVRDRTALARVVDDGSIENLYRLQLMNASEQPREYRIAVDGVAGAAIVDGLPTALGPSEARWVTVSVRVPAATANALSAGVHPIRFLIAQNDASRPVIERSSFIVPR